MTADKITVALVGNPNSGKTTIFNKITGGRQHVGNYSGVTVEKKEGYRNFSGHDLVVVDLPGTYSLTAYSIEEIVTRNFIVNDQPDIVIDVIDASNLERNLYLTVQLLELERPVILALNMIDMADKQGLKIDDARLQAGLGGATVVRTSGVNNAGIDALLDRVITYQPNEEKVFAIDYGPAAEGAIAALEPFLAPVAEKTRFPLRWLALKVLEKDARVMEAVQEVPAAQGALEKMEAVCRQLTEELGEDPEFYIAGQRYKYVAAVYHQAADSRLVKTVSTSDKIDRVLTNRIFGLPIFMALMWLVFNMVFTVGKIPSGWIESGFQLLTEYLNDVITDGPLKSLLVDGVVGGVGSVLVFIPSILLLFLAIAILEDSGYIARAAFIMDRVMNKVGLHGKSFIPLLLGFGCSTTAIMGTRILENPRDRVVTMLVTPLMSCSAKLPVYTILIAAFFDESMAGNVLFSIYLLGIVLSMAMARLFRSLLFSGVSEPFVMELPPYRMPLLSGVLIHMWERSVLYLRKAGTIILAASVLMWFLTTYPQDVEYSQDYEGLQQRAEELYTDESELNDYLAALKGEMGKERLAQSYAGQFGKFIEPAIAPLGFDWRIGISLVSGVTAKEVVVSTMGTIYSIGESEEGSSGLKAALAADGQMTPLKAYGMMVFVLIYSPCLAALAVMKRETGSFKWPVLSMVYATGLAWVMAFVIYQGGLLLGL